MPRATKRGRSIEDDASEALAGTLDCLGQKALAAKDMKREDSSEAASAVTLTPAVLYQKGNQECYTYPLLCSQSAQSSQGGDDTYQNSFSRGMDRQDGHCLPVLLDLGKQAAWESASKDLDREIASLLRSRESDTTLLRQSAESCLKVDGTQSYYLRITESEELQPVTFQTDFGAYASESKASLSKSLEDVLESEPPGPLGLYWEKLLQPHIHRRSKDAAAIQKVLTALSAVLPEKLCPATEVGKSSSWLAFSDAGRAVVDLRLHVGSALWASGFTKDASGLSPVYLSVPQGKALKELLQQEVEERSHRSWVIQEDSEATAGAELVLKALRGEAHSCGQGSAAASPIWEEMDSQAALVGPSNDLGAATEVVQEPGHLLALQRQGHCSLASGGVFLSWKVASGVQWPRHALREGQMRSNAVRRAALSSQNAWLAAEANRPPPLHVLRLLFAVACNIDLAQDSLVEGLQEHFVPLCMRDIQLQAQSVLPHMNARKGVLESPDHSALRCSCCSGEFLFSFVCLIKRKGERGGSLCWQCWSQRESLGLPGACRNARKCTVLQETDLLRLVAAIRMHRPIKRVKQSERGVWQRLRVYGSASYCSVLVTFAINR